MTQGTLSSGDTAWVLTSSALVLLMTVGIAFSPGNGWLGGLSWLGLNNVGLEPNATYSATIPLQAHAMFQGMFAIITPALISGAIVRRMRFRGYIVFLVLW